MRILILSTHYAPEHTGIGPYVAAIAEHLSRTHDVTVLASQPHYPAWRVEPEYAKWRTVERVGRLTVIRMSHYVPAKQDSARILGYELAAASRAIAEGLRHRADVVMAVTPSLFTAHVARVVARAHRARVCVMVQDIVSRAAAQSGIKGGRSVAGIATRIESSGLRHVDGVCTIHPRLAQVLTDDYGVSSGVRVIYNWSHIVLPVGDRAKMRAELGWLDDEVVVLHSGNMGNKQDLDNVISAARLADARGCPVRFVLAGDGNQRRRLEAQAAGVERLEIRSAVASESFPDFLAAADLLLINERAGMVEMSVPSKLTSYLASGRPVVAATDGSSATAELVAASGAGVITPANDPDALLTAVLKLAGDQVRMVELGQAGQRFAATRLDASSALSAYQEWLEALGG